MPIGPSHTSSRTWKTSAFVGRYRELQIFEDALWKRQAPSDYRIVSLYGIGGQGKTTVIEAYRRRLSEPDAAEVPLATIDLEDSEQRLMIPTLIFCRNAFREKGVATHLFDIAFARHHALARPGRDIRRDHPELFRFEGGVIGDLVDVANDVFFHFPGAKVLQQMLSRLGTQVAYWYRSQAEPLFEHLSKLNASGIRDELPMFLGADLHHQAVAHPDKRPVVLVDGYERLWADHPGGSASDAADLWLRRLVEESPGCLFVFAGRRPIRWERVDRDWTDLIQAHEILPLDDAAIESWFEQAGVVEEPIRQRIKESSMGYPLAITLQLSSYAKIKARGHAPQLEDFPLSHKDVIDRFMGHLEGALRTIYQIAAVPRHFDRHIWLHLQRAGMLPSNEYDFAEIADEVFFQNLDPERRIMHGIVRSHLLAEAEARKPELLHRVRLAVFDYLDRASSPDPLKREGLDIPDRSAKLSVRDTCLSEAAELLALANPRSFSNWCIHQFATDIRGSKIRVNLLDQAKKIVTDDPSETVGLALLCAETDPFSGDAETLLERALDDCFNLNEKAQEQLEVIVDWLTRFERKIKPRTLSSKLRPHIREGTTAALLLSLDQEDTAEALRLARLIMESEQKNPKQAILAAAALSGDRDLALRVYQARRQDCDLRDFDAICCLRNFLLVHRPEWGLTRLEALYEKSDRSQLLCHLAGNNELFSDCIAGLVGEALALVNKPGEAMSLIQQRLSGEQLQALEDFVSQRANLDQTQLRNELSAAQEDFASARWYLRALGRLAWGSERFQQLAENYSVGVPLEFVIAENGELFIFVSSPLVCNRGTDFYIISEDQTTVGITDPVGLLQCPIPAHLRGYIGQCSRVMLVLMDRNGKPLAGDYYLTRTADAADFDRINQELREARYQASERFRKASLDRP